MKGRRGLIVARVMHAADAEILAESLLKTHESSEELLRVTISLRDVLVWERWLHTTCRECGEVYAYTGPAARSMVCPMVCVNCWENGDNSMEAL